MAEKAEEPLSHQLRGSEVPDFISNFAVQCALAETGISLSTETSLYCTVIDSSFHDLYTSDYK